MKLWSAVIRITEWLGSAFLVLMVLLVFFQVVTRYIFAWTPSWSEETALLMMCWFGFLGIALGVAARKHLSIDVLTEFLPKPARDFLTRTGWFWVMATGVFMVWEGWNLVVVTNESTMAGTKLPSSVLYAVVPLSGVLVTVSSLLHLLGKNQQAGTGEGHK